jgi:FAS-associated factor 2
MPFPFNILFLPFNLTYTIFQRLFGTIGYLFPFLPRLLNRLYSGRALQPSRDTGRRPLNPTDTAALHTAHYPSTKAATRKPSTSLSAISNTCS